MKKENAKTALPEDKYILTFVELHHKESSILELTFPQDASVPIYTQ